jgi:hypothetical protein
VVHLKQHPGNRLVTAHLCQPRCAFMTWTSCLQIACYTHSCCSALQRLMAAFVVAWREVKKAQEAAAAEEAELFKTKTHAADIPTEEVRVPDPPEGVYL